jgi:hypothetical protein
MNKERILAVADAIEKGSVQGLSFDMTTYRNECGTAGCIAGWVFVMFAEHGSKTFRCDPRVEEYIVEQAAEILGIDEGSAEALFHAEGGTHRPEWGTITPQFAATVLRRLAETGEVDWSPVDTAAAS